MTKKGENINIKNIVRAESKSTSNSNSSSSVSMIVKWAAVGISILLGLYYFRSDNSNEQNVDPTYQELQKEQAKEAVKGRG